jgi:hypothetical protein
MYHHMCCVRSRVCAISHARAHYWITCISRWLIGIRRLVFQAALATLAGLIIRVCLRHYVSCRLLRQEEQCGSTSGSAWKSWEAVGEQGNLTRGAQVIAASVGYGLTCYTNPFPGVLLTARKLGNSLAVGYSSGRGKLGRYSMITH